MRLITLAHYDAFGVVERFELMGLHLPLLQLCLAASKET